MDNRLAPATVDAFLLPSLTNHSLLENRLTVVIDVLRATTTIVHALASGAERVIPFSEVEAARDFARRQDGQVLLGGERGGLPIHGFDLGNSPADYTEQRVGGKTLAITTTNGTRAMMCCRSAHTVLLAAFVNFSAICQRLADEPDVAIVCAGTNNEISREDVILAGAIADDLVRRSPSPRLNDQAEIAAEAWRAATREMTTSNLLESSLRSSSGGRHLIDIGQEQDIQIASQLDRFDLVPELHLPTWEILPA